MNRRFFKCLICLVLILTMIPVAHAAGSGAVSSNINDHFYINVQRWTDPIRSTLAAEDDGFLRVECIGENLVVEHYDQDLTYRSGQEIPLELPLYGGVYICDDYNFLLVGQTNLEEEDAKEVFRIIRYTKDWKKVDHASIYGANTTIPFDAGCPRFDRSGDILYIRTDHEMYTTSDGLNHQANVMIAVRISDMTVTDQFSDILNNGYGYVSHSFNQFVRVDGETLLAVDHGDAHPRSVALFKYSARAGDETFFGRTTMVNALPIVDSSYHYNDTGVSVGGFEFSTTNYLIAGCSYDQIESCDLRYAHRNIFVTATPKNDFTDEGTQIRWLTNYAAEDDVTVSPPHLVKLESDRFFLTWTENGELRYCFLNGAGQLEDEIYSGNGALSDCVPILDDNRIIWYVTDNSAPVFYQIDLNNHGSVTTPHTHDYTYAVQTAPTTTSAGLLVGRCSKCDVTDEVLLPILNKTDYDYAVVTAPGHNTAGLARYTWKNTTYGVWRFEVTLPACTHSYTSTTTEPTCTEQGFTTHTCTLCSYSYTSDYVDALGHVWEGANCTRCGADRPNPFLDTDPDRYYYLPLLWALDNDITQGTGNGMFSPDRTCTRAQVVTFLWRAAGAPEPVSSHNPFNDVSADRFYYKAVLWAVENNITEGKTSTTFCPDDPCTRGQVVTFLWRAKGTPAPISSHNPFTDVTESRYFYRAVLWAAENHITEGKTKTTFCPDDPCTRGQVVTFLYRAFSKET